MFKIQVQVASSKPFTHTRERAVYDSIQKSTIFLLEIMTLVKLLLFRTFRGQPSAENGKRAEENQVSRTSTSWRTFKMSDSRIFSFMAAFCLASLIFRAATQILDSWFTMLEHAYTGIWCPHHSCRDTHQSL
jgi:hypothetical protein